MGKVIKFIPKSQRPPKVSFDDELTELLKDAIEINKQFLGCEQEGVFLIYSSFENLIRAKMGAIILKEENVNFDLFRCSSYVSIVMGKMLSRVPDSYYAVDYYVRANNENNPLLLRDGADLCYAICTFFEGRGNRPRRATTLEDYYRMGEWLYSLYSGTTGESIGRCMSRNLKEIVAISQKCIKTI